MRILGGRIGGGLTAGLCRLDPELAEGGLAVPGSCVISSRPTRSSREEEAMLVGSEAIPRLRN